jgi:hypothetical protein
MMVIMLKKLRTASSDERHQAPWHLWLYVCK